MPKTIKEIYSVIEKFVSKDAFTWILKDSLSQKDLENISAHCRIQYTGTRAASQTSDVLSRDVAQEFFKNPKARELIAQYLHLSTQNEIEETKITSIPDILAKLRDPQSPMIATGKVGKFLWALLVDERSEAVTIIPIFILRVLETIRKFTNLLNQLKKEDLQMGKTAHPLRTPPVPSRDVLKLQEELLKNKKELEAALETLEKLGNKNKQHEERLEVLQEQYKTALAEAQELKHEKNILTKKIKDSDQMMTEIKSGHHDAEELKNKVHQIERENKMHRHELDRKDKEIESLSALRSDHEKILKNMQQLEQKIKDLESVIENSESEIYRLKESIKKEAAIKKIEKKAVKSLVPRVGIFVDVQNIFYAAKEKYEGKLDFQHLLHITLQGRRLMSATAYVVKTPEINQSHFFSTLVTMGYDVKEKNLKIRLDGSAKGDWDLGIAIDTISMSDKLDVVVLVSGDGDFVDLVHMLKSKNIRVEVASFPHNTSGDLIDAVDLHIPLDEKVLLPLK